MGANVTKSSVDIVNESIINVMLESAQNCSAGINSDQNITSSGFGIFGNYSQSATVSLSCLQNLQIDNNLITSMANKIVADTAQTNTPLLPSVNVGDTTTNIKNVLQTKITQSFVQSCVSALVNHQNQQYSGLQIGTVGKQDVNVMVSCISNALNSNGVAQSIVANTTTSTTQLSKNPFSVITDLFQNISFMMFAGFFLFVGGIIWLLTRQV